MDYRMWENPDALTIFTDNRAVHIQCETKDLQWGLKWSQNEQRIDSGLYGEICSCMAASWTSNNWPQYCRSENRVGVQIRMANVTGIFTLSFFKDGCLTSASEIDNRAIKYGLIKYRTGIKVHFLFISSNLLSLLVKIRT